MNFEKPKELEALTAAARKTPEYKADRIFMDVTETIVAEMERKGVSRIELARRIGVSPALVTKLLRGENNFTLETLCKIAQALNCELNINIQSFKKK